MVNVGIILAFLLLFVGTFGMILGVTSPEWLYNCVDGEEVYCYDRYSNPSQEKDCICESRGDGTPSAPLMAIGLFSIFIGFIMLIDALNSGGAKNG